MNAIVNIRKISMLCINQHYQSSQLFTAYRGSYRSLAGENSQKPLLVWHPTKAEAIIDIVS